MANHRDAWAAAILKRSKPNKYGAVKKVVDGHVFDSTKEALRFQELRLREKSGEIYGLELQPEFRLVVAVNGAEFGRVCVGTYKADFRYREGDSLVVEDVKSVVTRTAVYRLKKRMVEATYGITITEV